jgi:hypothetical protein
MNADKRRFKQDLQDKQDKSIFYPRHLRKSAANFAFKFSASLRLCGLIFLFAVSFLAQDLPDEIRGYKVHKTKVSVQTETGKNNSQEDFVVVINFDEPKLVKVTPLGATFEVFAEMTVLNQSGKIDFLTFKDFRINNLKVEIEEYKEPFEIEKTKTARLRKPFKIFVSTTQTIKGGLKEIFRAENEWQVTGRVFVFGKFKKSGFKFKRVVPVDVNLKIVNPLKATS